MWKGEEIGEGREGKGGASTRRRSREEENASFQPPTRRGRSIFIGNDPKQLDTILHKPLSSAPKQLQDIMMKLNRSDTKFKFLKGEKLVIADTLSKAYVKVTDPAENRLNIFSVKIKVDLQDSRLKEIITSTPVCSI